MLELACRRARRVAGKGGRRRGSPGAAPRWRRGDPGGHPERPRDPAARSREALVRWPLPGHRPNGTEAPPGLAGRPAPAALAGEDSVPPGL